MLPYHSNSNMLTHPVRQVSRLEDLTADDESLLFNELVTIYKAFGRAYDQRAVGGCCSCAKCARTGTAAGAPAELLEPSAVR